MLDSVERRTDTTIGCYRLASRQANDDIRRNGSPGHRQYIGGYDLGSWYPPQVCPRRSVRLSQNEFVLSPLRPEFAGTRQVIEEVTNELNLRCERVDDIQRSGTIHADRRASKHERRDLPRGGGDYNTS